MDLDEPTQHSLLRDPMPADAAPSGFSGESSSTLADLENETVEPLSADAGEILGDLLERASNSANAIAVIVHQGGVITDSFSIAEVHRILARPFGYALFHHRPIRYLLESQPMRLLELPASATVIEACRAGLERPLSQQDQPLVVVRGSGDRGTIPFHVVLHCMAKLSQEALKVVENQREMASKVAQSLEQEVQVRRQTEAALQEMVEVAKGANKAKSEFLANMSHEIRTPLTAILGFTDLLRDDNEPKERRAEILDTIRNAGNHLITVINDILDLSKIESGRVEVEKIDTSFCQLLREVRELIEPRAVAKQISFSISIDSEIPDRIVSDPTRLRQILLNLSGNAVKFTSEGSVTLAVSVVPTTQGQRLQFDCKDTGVGLTPEQMQRLFVAFGQADTTVTRSHGGTGLGLVISRRLASLMGGDVTLVGSEPGRGSCFRLELPMLAADGVKFTRTIDAAEQIRAASPTHAIKLRGRVLLAEDGIDNQRLISMFVKKAGAEVSIADNGAIALQILEDAIKDGTPFDLLLSDMQMPVLDGYSLAQTIRSRGWTIPIIALTAHAMAEDRRRCIEAGCDDYASKPIDRAFLMGLCAKWLDPQVSRRAAA